MKALFLAIPAALALSACSTTTPVKTTPAPSTQLAYERMAPEVFTCEDDSELLVKYLVDKTQTTITATVPKVSWSGQVVVLNRAPAASGVRYVNDSSDNIEYEWHAKGDTGIFAFNWANGNEYELKCQR